MPTRMISERRPQRCDSLAAFAPGGADRYLGELLAPLGCVATRRMFGKSGDVLRRADVRIVTDNTLYFRVDDHNGAAVREAEFLSDPQLREEGCAMDLSF
jgi:DNA transformation protein and related proteins